MRRGTPASAGLRHPAGVPPAVCALKCAAHFKAMKQLGSIPNPPYIWPHHRCGHFSYIFTLYNTFRHRASRLLCRQKIPAEVQTAGIHFKITGAAALSFDRSRCQTSDELTVRQQVYDQNRDQGDGSAGRHNVPFCRGVGRITQICHSHAQRFQARV